MSLISVIPALLDLKVNLQITNCHKKIAQEMLSALQKHCTKLLNSDNEDFKVIPAVACLADPTLAPCLLSTDKQIQALYGAKQFFYVLQTGKYKTIIH